MAIRTSIRAAALAALVIATGLAPSAPVLAAEARVPVLKVAASEGTSRFIPLGIGKSVAIDLPADIKDVLVADPKIANAVMRSSRRVYMIGVTVGQTNIFFFDADGKQIAGFDIAVTRDLNGVRAALKQSMPDADIRIEGVGDGIMLSGSAASAAPSLGSRRGASTTLSWSWFIRRPFPDRETAPRAAWPWRRQGESSLCRGGSRVLRRRHDSRSRRGRP